MCKNMKKVHKKNTRKNNVFTRRSVRNSVFTRRSLSTKKVSKTGFFYTRYRPREARTVFAILHKHVQAAHWQVLEPPQVYRNRCWAFTGRKCPKMANFGQNDTHLYKNTKKNVSGFFCTSHSGAHFFFCTFCFSVFRKL